MRPRPFQVAEPVIETLRVGAFQVADRADAQAPEVAGYARPDAGDFLKTADRRRPRRQGIRGQVTQLPNSLFDFIRPLTFAYS